MAALLSQLLSCFFWAFMWLSVPASVNSANNPNAPSAAPYSASLDVVVVNGSFVLANTDEHFICATLDWWPPEKCDYGTCSWGLASLLNLDLASNALLNAVKAFSPLKLRLGGTLQDKLIYDTGDHRHPCNPFVRNISEMFGFSQGCLPLQRWDELNVFFQKSGARIVFGLNALNGRVRMPDGSLGGPWDSSNAESFIRYTSQKGYAVDGWELGNELSGSGVGVRIGADQYAADMIALRKIVADAYRSIPSMPLILAPGGFFDSGWFSEFLTKVGRNTIDAITHHIYNLGPGVDEHLISKILNPSYLDGEARTFNDLQGILRTSGTSAVAWVGEAGGAYNSGRHLVSDTFVYSFWYLDQLGMSAKYDTKCYCRQSLVGGNYGLLNASTFQPNPDYYSALLWHRLMGTRVLSASFTGNNMIRSYAHCAKTSQGIVLLLLNLGSNTTMVRPVVTAGVLAVMPSSRGGTDRERSQRDSGLVREEYHLTAKDGNIQSQQMLLNGNVLAVTADGSIPSLEPVLVDATTQPIIVAPFSIVFVQLPSLDAPACR